MLAVQNLDLSENIGKFCKFVVLILGSNCAKALDLQRLPKKLNLKRSGAS